MSHPTLMKATDTHLRRLGTDLDTFLRTAIDRGDSSRQIAAELARVTDIDVSYRTVQRWCDRLGLREAS